jgi:hypothetical protein
MATTKRPTPLEPDPYPDAPVVSSEAQALGERQAFEAQRRLAPGGGISVLPGGVRHRVRGFVGAGYVLNKQARMLSDVVSILTDDWIREHQGWKYEWPIGESDETRMNLKNGSYLIVPPEAIRKDVNWAVVGDAITVVGTCVSWKRHLLVAVPYEVWYDKVVAPADYAIERTATGQDEADRLNSLFADHGLRAEVRAFEDARPEKIS